MTVPAEVEAVVGTAEGAELAAWYHHDLLDWEPDGYETIGAGSHRTVYLDHATNVVYKVGLESANRCEVHTLAELRRKGVDYAPPATLYEVEVPDRFDPAGPPLGVTVVAMPYLPDDGSIPGPRPVLPGANDFNPQNTVAHRGRYWLIDAGGL
ncbi:hypothetical protein E1091_00125 [Micromonospora fluostatini]|uniref:Aminoglycoside phosphotransferase n=1 Tax=Micromonospora fluostatini TaxID=1629071 RepID=A0ABY2DN09_9ACTN|nr:hypothetical protein E1091_00125 [Micromonospora fluostatini]